MKRLARWTVRLAVALSLVLAVAAGVLWSRGYGSRDRFTLHRADDRGGSVRYRFASLGSSGGLACIAFGHSAHSREQWDRALESHGRFFPAPGQGWSLGIEKEHRDPRAVIARHADQAHEFAGIACYREATAPASAFPAAVTHWLIPYSYLATLFGIPPLLWLALFIHYRFRRRQRRRKGLCLNCGYDLRATPSACPECGAVPQAAPGPG